MSFLEAEEISLINGNTAYIESKKERGHTDTSLNIINKMFNTIGTPKQIIITNPYNKCKYSLDKKYNGWGTIFLGDKAELHLFGFSNGKAGSNALGKVLREYCNLNLDSRIARILAHIAEKKGIVIFDIIKAEHVFSIKGTHNGYIELLIEYIDKLIND